MMAKRTHLEDPPGELLRCAREVFSSKGFKQTNIADITSMAGVAVGTFYNYFPSKESIFIRLFREENHKLKEDIMRQVDLDAGPAQVIPALMALNDAGMRASPILREWYDRDVFQKIESAFREENDGSGLDFMFSAFNDLIRRWQQQGRIRADLEPEMVMAFFHALINTDLHKEEIGLQFFPEIMHHLAQFILDGIRP